VGTTFTVGDLGTAFQIDGGPGQDTLLAPSLTFTADQRTAIFKTSSIETITDSSGTYTSPLVSQTAPAAPVIMTTAPAQDKASSIDIAGTAEPGSTVALYNNGNPVGTTTTVDAGGNWQIKAIALTDGADYSFTAKATDAAGNTSGASSALAFHDDQTAPAAPAIMTTAPVQDNASSIDIAGTAEPGSTVALYNNGNQVGTTTTADGFGNWQIKAIALTDGADYSFTAKATDAAGNTSGASNALAFHDDQTAPVVADKLAKDTGSLSTDNVTSNDALTGTGDPNAAVHFTVDGNAIATTATANSAGVWTFTPTGLSDGSHTIVASETDLAGNTGKASLTFTLDTTAPVVSFTSEASGNGGKVVLGGTSDTAGTVNIYDNGTLIGTTGVSNGAWSFTTNKLSNVVHSFTVNESDVAGNLGTSVNKAIFGSSAGDTLQGGVGNDLIIGNGGNDTFVGGGGADILFGGSGHDAFVYNAITDSTPASHDTIFNFNHSTDQIEFAGIAGITSSNGIPTFEGKLTGSGNLTLNAHSVGYIEVGGNTEVLVNTTASAESVTLSDTHAANMEIVLSGTHLGLTSQDSAVTTSSGVVSAPTPSDHAAGVGAKVALLNQTMAGFSGEAHFTLALTASPASTQQQDNLLTTPSAVGAAQQPGLFRT
jgi:Ca2+-binding RTX toxin-like protein